MLPDKLNNLLAKRGGDLLILVFSLLLAFFIWAMHSFTQHYSTFYTYKVVADSNIEGRARSALSYNSLVLRGKSSGFFILQQRLEEKTGETGLHLFVDSRMLAPVEGKADLFYVLGEDLRERVQEALGNDFELESITTDTLYFQFPKQANKKVPVVADQNISYAPQYMSFGKIQLTPDSVVVYGNEEIVKNIDAVYTQTISEHKADSPVQGVVGLKSIRGVRFSDEHIYYSLAVGRFFETSIRRKVNVINAPADAGVILIPHEIELTYRMHFEDKKEHAESAFKVVVDYNSIGRSNIAKPYVVRKPANIIDLKCDPVFIECIVN